MTILRNFLLFVTMLVAAVVGASAAAQSPAPPVHIRADLIAERGAVPPGEEVMLAIRFQPEAGWHGYWENPGDAGFGLRLQWQLPAGIAPPGPAQYPVPQTLLIGKLMNHVYEGEHAVLLPLRIAAGARPGQTIALLVDADWLACTDRECVPQRARLSGAVTVAAPGSALPAPDPRFLAWRGAIAPALDQPGRFKLEAATGGKLRIAIPLPAGAGIDNPHLFLQQNGVIDYAAPQRFTRAGDELRITLSPPPGGVLEAPTALSGLLRIGLTPDGKPLGLQVQMQPGAVAQGGTAIAAGAGNGTGAGSDSANTATPGLFWALLGAIAGGLMLNAMPCVFPILSLKALALARAGGEARSARSEALAYTAGVMLTCLALGGLMLGLRAAGQQVGWAFQLQQPGVVIALLLLTAAITANLAGWFEVAAPDVGGSVVAGTAGSGRSGFATGALAAIVATPCSGPFMATAMGAALLLPWPQALAIFAGLGLGLALPFLALGFIPALRRRLPAPGAWMARLRHWMAVPMALTALALLWLLWRMGGMMLALTGLLALGLLLGMLLAIGRRQHRGIGAGAVWIGAITLVSAGAILAAYRMKPPAPSATVASDALGSEPFSEARLAQLRGQKRGVFVYFTADWCITCKANEVAAINRTETVQAFKSANIAVLRGDWTRSDPAITRYLQAQGVAGVPLYLWVPPGAATTTPMRRLPQLLTPAMMQQLAQEKQ